MNFPLAAIVLCAGKGTRMRSEHPKVLHPLLGRPLGYYPIARALELGASPLVAVVGHQGDDVESALSQAFPGRGIQFAVQREQRGTADAVKAAGAALAGFDGAILILYGDVPLIRAETLAALVERYRGADSKLAMATTELADPTGYGRVVRAGGKVARVVEQKDCTPEQARITEGNAGLYVVEAKFLWRALDQVGTSNAQRELYLTDLVELAAKEGDVPVAKVAFDEVAGVNDRAELAARARALQQQINLRHMRAGVTLADPSTAYIDEDVVIGADTEIGPMVTLQSGTRIGANVRIGQGCVLQATTVADGTVVRPYSVFEETHVGRDCQIGPFSRLRPGTKLAEQVHLGNFVETKKAAIGKGSKANHLAYLGDAEIGAGVNVGAGTITCNYDGKNKNRTVLEDGVFIGSDSQLVAPVRVGKDAYVGAGSTITKNVPPGALAISRAQQVTKEGWVERKRARDAGQSR